MPIHILQNHTGKLLSYCCSCFFKGSGHILGFQALWIAYRALHFWFRHFATKHASSEGYGEPMICKSSPEHPLLSYAINTN